MGSASLCACSVMTMSDTSVSRLRAEENRNWRIRAEAFFKCLLGAMAAHQVPRVKKVPDNSSTGIPGTGPLMARLVRVGIRPTNCRIASLSSKPLIGGGAWMGATWVNPTFKLNVTVTPLAPGAEVNSISPSPVSRRFTVAGQ